MQLKLAVIVAICLFVILPCTVVYGVQTNNIQINSRPIAIDDFEIDAIFSSGIVITGIRYRKDRDSKNWRLEMMETNGPIYRTSKLTIHFKGREAKSLSQNDMHDLIAILTHFIKENHKGQLNSIVFDLFLVDGLLEEVVTSLREAMLPPNYRLKLKDSYLATEISVLLQDVNLVKAVCAEIINIQKTCRNEYVEMHGPILFESQNVGNEWHDVEFMPNAGMVTSTLRFSVKFENIDN